MICEEADSFELKNNSLKYRINTVDKNVLKPSRINETGGKFFDFILENLIKYSEFKYEIEKWIIFRDVLLEKITIPDKFLTNKY